MVVSCSEDFPNVKCHFKNILKTHYEYLNNKYVLKMTRWCWFLMKKWDESEEMDDFGVGDDWECYSLYVNKLNWKYFKHFLLDK